MELNKDILNLLELSKKTARLGLKKIAELDKKNITYTFSKETPKEVKTEADLEIESLILEHLKPTGLEILSEEIGLINSSIDSNLRFIIDPIDGTVNFIRNIAECSISIALFEKDKPIFGVLASYPSGKLFWGGANLGSFEEDVKIEVSLIAQAHKGVLCSGFPSRFKFDSEELVNQIGLMKIFNKTRMLGSASQSLLQVAKGSAECYYENEIMLWDVAAGLAIVEGSGGRVIMKRGATSQSFNIIADNGLIKGDIYQKLTNK